MKKIQSKFDFEIISFDFDIECENKIIIKCDKKYASSIGAYFVELLQKDITNFSIKQL
jgi:hypothetical protein